MDGSKVEEARSRIERRSFSSCSYSRSQTTVGGVDGRGKVAVLGGAGGSRLGSRGSAVVQRPHLDGGCEGSSSSSGAMAVV